MKRVTNLTLLKNWFSNSEEFEWFRKRFPSDVCIMSYHNYEYFFKVWKDSDNATDCRECLEYLTQVGFKSMPRHRSRIPHEDTAAWRGFYDLRQRCEYSAKDCAKSELVNFSLDADLSEGCRMDEVSGEVCVDLDDLRNEGGDYYYEFLNGELPFIELLDGRMAVSLEGKALLESSGLTGFCIMRPLWVEGDGIDKLKGSYWQVDLPVVLPRSEKMQWERADGQIYTGRWEPEALQVDDLLSFDRAALQTAGPFDLAVQEPMRNCIPKLGSHRWFEFCKANKIRCDWKPVKLVD